MDKPHYRLHCYRTVHGVLRWYVTEGNRVQWPTSFDSAKAIAYVVELPKTIKRFI